MVYAANGPTIISAFAYDHTDTRWMPDNTRQVLMAKLAKTIADSWR